MYGDTAPGLNHYWKDLSFGLANVAGSAAYGPYTLPRPLAAYVINGQPELTELATDCSAAADADVNFPQFDGINMAFNSTIGCCAWGGRRTMTLDGVTKTYRTTWLPPWATNSISVVMHEMGHGFGLPHSSADYGETYDSPWDVMSKDRANCAKAIDPVYGCIGQGTISYHKDILGWIAPEQKYTHRSGTQTITLTPLGLPGASGYLMAQIPIDGSDTHFYTVEARGLASYDAKLPGAGVIIHEVDTNRDRPARVIDADLNGDPGDAGAIWTPGETFTGQDYVTVTVDEKAGDAFTVTLSNVGPSVWTDNAVGAGASGDLDDEGAVTLRGRGGDIFGAADSFYFAHQTATGSMAFVGRVTAWDAAGGKSAKAGLMVRGSLDAAAPHFTVHLTGPGNAVKLKWRDATGQATASADLPGKIKLPAWLKIIKTGRTFAAFHSADGQTWTQIAPPVTLPGFPETFRYGMAVTSNDAARTAQATFADVAATPWATAAVGDGSGGTATEAGDGVVLRATGGDIFGTADSFLYYALSGRGDDSRRGGGRRAPVHPPCDRAGQQPQAEGPHDGRGNDPQRKRPGAAGAAAMAAAGKDGQCRGGLLLDRRHLLRSHRRAAGAERPGGGLSLWVGGHVQRAGALCDGRVRGRARGAATRAARADGDRDSVAHGDPDHDTDRNTHGDRDHDRNAHGNRDSDTHRHATGDRHT